MLLWKNNLNLFDVFAIHVFKYSNCKYTVHVHRGHVISCHVIIHVFGVVQLVISF